MACAVSSYWKALTGANAEPGDKIIVGAGDVGHGIPQLYDSTQRDRFGMERANVIASGSCCKCARGRPRHPLS